MMIVKKSTGANIGGSFKLNVTKLSLIHFWSKYVNFQMKRFGMCIWRIVLLVY